MEFEPMNEGFTDPYSSKKEPWPYGEFRLMVFTIWC